MRKLIFAALVACCSAVGQITLLSHGSQSCAAGGTCTTPDVTINTTGATLLWVIINAAASNDPNTASTIADGQANTWIKLTSVVNSVGTSQWYAYQKAGAALSLSATHTFHFTGVFPSFEVAAFSGTLASPTSPFDKQATPTSTAGATSLATGSITCSQSNSLILSGAAFHTAWTTTYAIDTGFTLLDKVNFLTGQTAGSGSAYLIQTGAASPVNPNWSGAPSGNIATTITCFKGATSAAPIRHKVSQ